jgi:hypothetical protein
MIGPIRRLFEAHPIACDLHCPVAFYRDIPGPPLADVIAECNLASFRVPTLDKTMPGLWSSARRCFACRFTLRST